MLPQLGRIYDAAKIASAGGAEAFAALAPGSARMQAVLRDAAEISFQTVAVIPAVLLGIFALLWLWERRVHAAGSARA